MRRNKMRILVVEDEVLLAHSIKEILNAEKYEVDLAYDGEEGESYALLGIYDLIILDIMMPKKNGFEVAKSLRNKRYGTPILMLTAKSSVEDRVYGLNAGGDYYLPKPFDKRELLACIHALLRRQGHQVNEIIFGNTALDLDTCMLICEENSMRLSAKEYEIIRILMQSPKRIFSKEMLLTKVWGFDSNAVENNVEVYIGFLRKKLQSIKSNIRIESIRKMGYHLEVDEE